MDSSIYFFFLAGSDSDLDFLGCSQALENGGFCPSRSGQIETFSNECQMVDATRIRFGGKSMRQNLIEVKLSSHQQLNIEYKAGQMSLLGGFGSPHPKPLFSLGVFLRDWDEHRSKLENLLVEVAKAGRATSFVSVFDPLEEFYCSLAYIDERWVFDLEYEYPHLTGQKRYWSYGSSTLWSTERERQLPVLRNLKEEGGEIGGYRIYREFL